MINHQEDDVWKRKLDWKSKPFTFRYAQPPEYRYSLDSIELMWRLGTFLRSVSQPAEKLRVLDLCCGCGVLGFELHYWIAEKIESAVFADVQKKYESYFETNRKITGTADKPFQFCCINYCDIPQLSEFSERFNLILCNPPYFRRENGSVGISDFRNRCHFLLDGSFSELCSAIFHCLAPRGQAYVLLKDLSVQGIDQLKELQKSAGEKFECTEICRVRGTPVVRIQRTDRSSE
jgi:tRNA1(Val) A37 N6-methylase TrmN6